MRDAESIKQELKSLEEIVAEIEKNQSRYAELVSQSLAINEKKKALNESYGNLERELDQAKKEATNET